MSEPATELLDSLSPEAFDQKDVLGLPFDQYQRYRLIQESIESIRWNARLTVLDVSKSPRLLDRFLPNDHVVAADITDQSESESFVDGKSLAFDDAAFDVVVTSDVLPDLPPDQRHNFLTELTRVAREAVIISAPFDDPAVVQSEEVFRSLIWAQYGEGYDLMEVHRRYGLPNLDETQAVLSSKGLQTTVLPNGYLHRWLVAISTFYLLQWRFDDAELNATANTYYNSNFYQADHREPSYRKLLLAARTRNIGDLRAELCPAPPVTEDDRLFHLQMLNLLVQTLTDGWSSRALEKERALQIVTTQLADSPARIQSLIAQVGERQSAVESLAAQLAERHERALALTEQVAERQGAVDSLGAQLTLSREKVLSLTEELGERQKAVDSLSPQLSESQQRLLSLTEGLAEQQRAIDSLSAQLSESHENVRVLTESLTEQETTADLLREQLRTKSRLLLPIYRLFKKGTN